jgi:formiminoglutamase
LKPENFYEMTYQSFAVAQSHLDYLREKGAHVHSLNSLRQVGLMNAFQEIVERSKSEVIFWGIDLDSVHLADAPGVSAPNVLGLTADELCQITELAGREPRTQLIEFTEVNPTYDIDGRTCRLTAVAIWHFLNAIAQEQA